MRVPAALTRATRCTPTYLLLTQPSMPVPVPELGQYDFVPETKVLSAFPRIARC